MSRDTRNGLAMNGFRKAIRTRTGGRDAIGTSAADPVQAMPHDVIATATGYRRAGHIAPDAGSVATGPYEWVPRVAGSDPPLSVTDDILTGPDRNGRTDRHAQPAIRHRQMEAYRVLACLGIIIAHCEMALGVDTTALGQVVQHFFNITLQSAVPLFFILSGYTLAPKLSARRWTPVIRHTQRVLTIFIAASFAYLVFMALLRVGPRYAAGVVVDDLIAVLRDPVPTLLRGTAPHLWFLPSLIAAVWGTALLCRLRNRGLMLVTGVSVYGLLLLTGPYRTVSGVVVSDEMAVLWSGLPWVIVGTLIRLYARVPSRHLAATFILMGTLVQVAEQVWLASYWSVDTLHVRPWAGTAVQAIGFSFMALQPACSALSQRISDLGRLTLLVYLNHMAFLFLLNPLTAVGSRAVWRIAYPMLVTLLALACAAALIGLRREFRRRFILRGRVQAGSTPAR